MSTGTSLALNTLEKAMQLNFKTWLRTGNDMYKDNYLYYMVEKERLLLQEFTPAMTDKEYSELDTY